MEDLTRDYSQEFLQETLLLTNEFEGELVSIARWWANNSIDEKLGGFVGELTFDGKPVPGSQKGIVLNTRILWFFSEVALFFKDEKYRQLADRAYEYIAKYFIDYEYGGVVWTLDEKGQCINGRKQIYAQAFAIYAFSAYYRLTNNGDALTLSYSIFDLIETHGFDKNNLGYFEAFSQEWGTLADIRLSEKDLNSPKTMNTHLHILEAYTSLYALEENHTVGLALRDLIACYERYFIDRDTYHLKMFLGINWDDESKAFSYGHDIESSWLIWEAIEVLNDPKMTKYFNSIVKNMVETCFKQGIAGDGSVLDIYDFEKKEKIVERVWWVQAEAMVGFFNAYQITRDEKYLQALINIWNFVKSSVIDSQYGEWHWLALPDQAPGYSVYKLGFWKGPYHNGRAMLELCRRISHLT